MATSIPVLPKGYQLDGDGPTPPAGYTIDGNSSPSPTATSPTYGSSIGNILGNVVQHAKNAVTGPINAFTQPADPNNAQEVNASAPWSQGGAGKLGLGLYRMTAEPTVNAAQQAVQQYKAGDKVGALNSAEDAIPIAGPWARSVENDVRDKGAIAGMAGMATDLIAPGVAAKGAGMAMRGAGYAGRFASTTPAARQLLATRALTTGTPGELLQSALKPGVKYGADVGMKVQSAIPDVLQANPKLRGVSGFAKAADTARDMQGQKYNNLIAPYRPAPGGVGPIRPGSIYGAPVAEAQMRSIPAINMAENANTGIVMKTGKAAETYDRDIPVAEADDIRQDANAKLNAFYSRTGGDQNAALSNPETARIKAIGDTMRQSLYSKLESDNGLAPDSVAQMQQRYGTLAETSDIANKREPVFARHDPVSLSQRIATGHGNPVGMAANFLVQKALKGATDSDALVNSAIDRYQNPTGTPLPAGSSLYSRAIHAGSVKVSNAGQVIAKQPFWKTTGRLSLYQPHNQ